MTDKDTGADVQLRTLSIPNLLTVLLLLCVAAVIFILLADAISSGFTANFDQRILLSLRNSTDLSDPLGPPVIEAMVRDVTALGGMTLITLTTISVAGYLWFSDKHALAVLVIGATVGAILLSSVLKVLIDRPRPDLVPHNTIVSTQSFPSGHATQAAATYLTLGALLAGAQKRRRSKIFIFALAILVTISVGISRVYLGVHWPTDVLAGWTAGAAWALVCWYIAQRLPRNDKVKG